MKIVIKNPAPIGSAASAWGDFDFGLSLQQALQKEGEQVTQHFWPEWGKEEPADVVLVLRGKRRYSPPAGQAAAMWVISHPSTVTVAEIEQYRTVFVASEGHAKTLRERTKTPVHAFRQCTDTNLFYPKKLAPSAREGIIFVANSRGVLRTMVRWSIDLGLKPKLIGRSWGGAGLAHWVTQEHIANDRLPDLYRSAALGLNDHWEDMRHFGYISNRIFDSLACGLPVLSDEFAELREVCGGGVLYASDLDSFRQALTEYALYYRDVATETSKLWELIGPAYTFETRAKQMAAILKDLPAQVAQGRSADPRETAAPGALLRGWRAAAGCFAKRSSRRIPKLLHVGCTEAGMTWLLEQSDGGYLSGGFGAGPWHLAIPEAPPSIREERFDLIVVEDPLQLGSDSQQGARLQCLAQRLHPQGGMLLLAFGVSTQTLEELIASGMKRVVREECWILLEWRREE